MLRLLLVRHGQTEWNRDRRIMGREPVGLNPEGVAQSQRLRDDIQGFEIHGVYTSPLVRAKQTAEIIAEGCDLNPKEDPRLEEVGYGEWVGLTFKEARETPGYVPYFKRLDSPVAPGGETLFQVRDRALKFLEDLEVTEDGNTVIAVTHADLIKCLIMAILEIPFENIWKMRIDNGALTQIESEKGRRRLICLNQSNDIARLFESRIWF